MRKPLPELYDSLPVESQLRLDRACRDFEAAWHSGQRPEMQAFLQEVPQTERRAFVQELVLLDIEYRRAGNCSCAVEDYLARHPELDRAWVLDACTRGADTREAASPGAVGGG